MVKQNFDLANEMLNALNNERTLVDAVNYMNKASELLDEIKLYTQSNKLISVIEKIARIYTEMPRFLKNKIKNIKGDPDELYSTVILTIINSVDSTGFTFLKSKSFFNFIKSVSILFNSEIKENQLTRMFGYGDLNPYIPAEITGNKNYNMQFDFIRKNTSLLLALENNPDPIAKWNGMKPIINLGGNIQDILNPQKFYAKKQVEDSIKTNTSIKQNEQEQEDEEEDSSYKSKMLSEPPSKLFFSKEKYKKETENDKTRIEGHKTPLKNNENNDLNHAKKRKSNLKYKKDPYTDKLTIKQMIENYKKTGTPFDYKADDKDYSK